jgi:malate permease and related proteins
VHNKVLADTTTEKKKVGIDMHVTPLAASAFNQILIMFIIILVGMFSYRLKLIDQEANKKLSDIVLMLVNPLVIFVSYQKDFQATLLSGLLISLVLAVATHLFSIILAAFVLPKRGDNKDIAIERFAMIYSNCGFIGIPLVNGIFGSDGVFYLTAYMTIFNLVVWTHGVITMTGKSDRETIIKAVLSPSVIATLLGFVFFIARIMLPEPMLQAVSYIGNMNTPMAMLVAGVTMAQTDILKLISKIRIYYITFFKLIFVPIAMLFLYSIFDIPNIVLLTSILATACPTAATVNLFSIRYGKNYLYASELFTVTTILSFITIPIVMTIAEFIVK